MKKIEQSFITVLTLYGIVGVFEKLRLLNIDIYNTNITYILIMYLVYRFYMKLYEIKTPTYEKEVKLFYYTEIVAYIILSIVLSFYRVSDNSKSYYYIMLKWETLLILTVIYSLLFLIFSFVVYKKNKDKKIWFINVILLYFRIFLLIEIWKYRR